MTQLTQLDTTCPQQKTAISATGSLSTSVIIPTRYRPVDVEHAVESVFCQTTLPQELIIVDQSNDEESVRRIELKYTALPSDIRERVKLVFIHDNRISGLAAARNRAIQVATGNVWLFLDDDVYLESDFLEQLLLVYHDRPDATGVSGVITNYVRPTWTVRCWSEVFLRGPFRDDRQPIYWSAARLRHAGPIRVSRLGGGLMSFRAAAVRGMSFDENLLGVCDGEDVDFCVRLGSGAVLLMTPSARLTHNQSPAGRLRDHWLRRVARGSSYLYRKNWDKGLKNYLCWRWLNLGCASVAAVASMRRVSLAPWRAWREGEREARDCLLRAWGLAR